MVLDAPKRKKVNLFLWLQRIEGVVAHEYFHNWTGNRVTCRDWFQVGINYSLSHVSKM